MKADGVNTNWSDLVEKGDVLCVPGNSTSASDREDLFIVRITDLPQDESHYPSAVVLQYGSVEWSTDDTKPLCTVDTIGSTDMEITCISTLDESIKCVDSNVLYDQNKSDFRIEIDQKNTCLLVDYIFYENGEDVADEKRMMNQGIQMTFTDHRSVRQNMPFPDQKTAVQGSKYTHDYTFQIGMANEIVRQLTFQFIPSGNVKYNADLTITDVKHERNQTLDLYNHLGLPFNACGKNPLLNQYVAVGTPISNGTELQLLINSVPYFPKPIAFSQQQYGLHSECHGKALQIPEGYYNAYTSAKQKANQVGFLTTTNLPSYANHDNNSIEDTLYRINAYKGSFVQDTIYGHSQEHFIGMGNYQGVSFRLHEQNVVGNGVRVGALPMQLEIKHNYSPFAPLFAQNMMMQAFCEVERVFVLKNGFITVSNASY